MKNIKKDVLLLFLFLILSLVCFYLSFGVFYKRWESLKDNGDSGKETLYENLSGLFGILMIIFIIITIYRYIQLLKNGGKVKKIAIALVIVPLLGGFVTGLAISKEFRTGIFMLIAEGIVLVFVIIIVIGFINNSNVITTKPKGETKPQSEADYPNSTYVSFEFRYFNNNLEKIVSDNFPGSNHLVFDVINNSGELLITSYTFPGCGYIDFHARLDSNNKITQLFTDHYPELGYVNFNVNGSTISCDHFLGGKYIYFTIESFDNKITRIHCDNFPTK